MGTYGVSKKELIERLVECLDDTEGDFNTQTLTDVLEILKYYCPTSNSNEWEENKWEEKLKEIEDENN